MIIREKLGSKLSSYVEKAGSRGTGLHRVHNFLRWRVGIKVGSSDNLGRNIEDAIEGLVALIGPEWTIVRGSKRKMLFRDNKGASVVVTSTFGGYDTRVSRAGEREGKIWQQFRRLDREVENDILVY